MCSFLALSSASCQVSRAAPPAPDAGPPAPSPVPVAAPAFSPGRYACDVIKAVRATHDHNSYSEDTRASFVLDFGGDGRVSGCRGKRSLSLYDGPSASDRTVLREQQGYRGSWQVKEGWLEVTLTPDNTVCKRLRQHKKLAPSPWRLRCQVVTKAGERVLTPPAVACKLMNKPQLNYDEGFGLFPPRLLPGDSLLLGRGNGLAISWVVSDAVDVADETPVVTVEESNVPVDTGTWEQPGIAPAR